MRHMVGAPGTACIASVVGALQHSGAAIAVIGENG